MRPHHHHRPVVALVLVLTACAGRDIALAIDGHETGPGSESGTSGTSEPTGTSYDDECGGGRCSEADASSEDGCNFIPCMDVPPARCDIWLQDCRDGEKCTAYASEGASWDAYKCVAIMGEGQPGEVCTATDGDPRSGNDDCADASMCWGIDPDTGVGHCVAFCTGDADDPQCAGDRQCAVFDDGWLALCSLDCDPLAAGADCAEPETNLCAPAPNGHGFICVPPAPAPGAHADPCELANECGQGLFCAAADAVPGCQSERCCSQDCDLNQPNTCIGQDDGQVCVPWFEMGMAPPGYEHVGACALT